MLDSKKLFEILPKNLIKQILGSKTKEIKDLVFDSRRAQDGSLFFAIKGELGDGHDYIEKAVALGAVASIVDLSLILWLYFATASKKEASLLFNDSSSKEFNNQFA